MASLIVARLLKEAGFTAKETNVIGVEVPDQPGELARIMSLFRDEGVGIEYLAGKVADGLDLRRVGLHQNELVVLPL